MDSPKWQDDVQPALARFAFTFWVGAGLGFVIGGIGGRLAMLVLRLTSDPSLHGVETDDGFIIGRVSGDTAFLLGVTAVIGALGGVVYGALRSWLPEKSRASMGAVIYGVIGGAAIIRPDGIDFKDLEPRSVAVVMFIAIPALYGALLPFVVERWIDGVRGTHIVLLVVAYIPVAMSIAAGFGAVIFFPMVVGWAVVYAVPAVRSFLRSRAVTVAGQIGICVVTVVFGGQLVSDVLAIL